jgi:small subunit ribosomal protein S8
MTDPISDYLTRIRNAQTAGHRSVDVPASNLKRAITKILLDKGFIQNFMDIDDNKQGILRIFLKYDQLGHPVIRDIHRVSRPGLRQYAACVEIPRYRSGLGITIVSTSKGVMTDKEARALNVGGEVLCQIF